MGTEGSLSNFLEFRVPKLKLKSGFGFLVKDFNAFPPDSNSGRGEMIPMSKEGAQRRAAKASHSLAKNATKPKKSHNQSETKQKSDPQNQADQHTPKKPQKQNRKTVSKLFLLITPGTEMRSMFHVG